ncbi:Rieske (2Fe-2S) protein [Streptomyces sp. SM11]|uniref:Rieske (2Fe-2S) protein n=1 Tax=Streptomyces sp. SM11 TaxID=565557 RepID=UPI000CD5289A|nr:Rieske (2Fe-2S) protein [Streptomyces sp. SM11]
MNARRRTVLAAGAAGAAALATGCGSSDGDGGGDTTGTPTTSAGATDEAADGASPGTSDGVELAGTGDIPVGGGTVFKERKVVVTQPEEGEFKAFSAVCTHASCLVSTVSDGTINCPCHGSRYSITDAAVEAGPAPRPLPAERISVSDGTIRLG